jgi:hypothetical protein
MRQNGAPHLIGEITFRTESGWFQVVPMQTATLEQIERLNDKCAR